MTNKELNLVWDPLFDAKIAFEDMLELAKAGFPHGYKKGVVERKLRQAEKALNVIDAELKGQDNG